MPIIIIIIMVSMAYGEVILICCDYDGYLDAGV